MGEELDDLPFLVFTLIFNTIQVHVTNLAENSSRCLFQCRIPLIELEAEEKNVNRQIATIV